MMVYALLDGVTESHTEVDHLTSCESESESDKDEGGSSTSPLCECPTCTLDDSPCQLLDVSKSKHVYSHQAQCAAKTRSYKRSS